MADIKTVMSWVEGLTQDDWRWNYSDSEVQETAKAALALLKAQEPRVLTWEEAEKAEVCWLEQRGYEPYVTDDADTWNPEIYGKAYRCWSLKPTDEQRKAIKWDD